LDVLHVSQQDKLIHEVTYISSCRFCLVCTSVK